MCLDAGYQLPGSNTNYTFAVDSSGTFMQNGDGNTVVDAMNDLVATSCDSYLQTR